MVVKKTLLWHKTLNHISCHKGLYLIDITSIFSIIMAIYNVPVVIVEEDHSFMSHNWDLDFSGGGAALHKWDSNLSGGEGQ